MRAVQKVSLLTRGWIVLVPLALSAAHYGNFEYESDGSSVIITRYSGEEEHVEIPATIEGLPVISIGDGAFYFCRALSQIVIPDSVISIGKEAFGRCSSLTNIVLGHGLTSIGDRAFNGCGALGQIIIPDSVTSIGKWAFAQCGNLTNILVGEKNPTYCSQEGVLFSRNLSVLIQYPAGKPDSSYTIPFTVTSIDDNAFAWCNALTQITLPDFVASIGMGAFAGCNNLTNILVAEENPTYCSQDGILFTKDLSALIQYPAGKPDSSYTIPSTVTSIGDEAFSGCANLGQIIIPDSVASIGKRAFANCYRLTNVALGHGFTSISDGMFMECMSLAQIILPDSIASIGDDAFNGCGDLGQIIIPDSVTSIGKEAFHRCQSLTNIALGHGLTSIGDGVFKFCPRLPQIIIPDSVISIGKMAFAQCGNLTNILVAEENPAYCSQDGVLFTKDLSVLIRYPAAKPGSSYTVPSTVTSIDDGAFDACRMTQIIIPDSVASIGKEAFAACGCLTNVVLGHGITSIGDGAFTLCRKLPQIIIPDSVTSIGKEAFVNCWYLTSVAFGSGLTSIGDRAFYRCACLKRIYFQGPPPDVSSIRTHGSQPTIYYLPGTPGWGDAFGGCPAILWNPVIDQIAPTPNGLALTIKGTADIPVALQFSPDLTSGDWTTLATTNLTGGVIQIQDASRTNSTAGFYRVTGP